VAADVEFEVSKEIAAVARDPFVLRSRVRETILDSYSRRRWAPSSEINGVEPVWLGAQTILLHARVRKAAEDVTAILLATAAGVEVTRRSIDRWPPSTAPYWGGGNLILAVYVIAVAWLRVTPISLLVTVAVSALAIFLVLVAARKGGAVLANVALGMAPSAVIMGCAVYYGASMIGTNPSIILTWTTSRHLVDAFLLSFGLASTGGIFDLGLRSTTSRVVALAEMLLMLSVIGTSIYRGARATWDRLAEIGQGNSQ